MEPLSRPQTQEADLLGARVRKANDQVCRPPVWQGVSLAEEADDGIGQKNRSTPSAARRRAPCNHFSASRLECSPDTGRQLPGHSASCPPETTLIRGRCYDSTLNPAANNFKEAAEDCATKAGNLPSVAELYEIREVLNLGKGTGTEHAYSNEVYANTAQANYSTVTVDGNGALTEQPISAPSSYICAYTLLR